MFSEGPWNSAPASSPNWMLPRGRLGIWLLRVQTTNKVDPGRYSQRSTALPRRERKVKLGSVRVSVGAPPPRVSASRRIVAGSREEFAAGWTTTVPKSRPYWSRCAVRGAAYTLYRLYAPVAISGCMNSSSVKFGENVTLKRVSIDTEFCVRCANTWRVPKNDVAVGSA